MIRREDRFFVSLLIIPGAGMELYDSVVKLIYEHHFGTWWDYAKFFFLAVAMVAAVTELFHRLTHVIDGASAALIMAGSFMYGVGGGVVLVARGLLGYGWSVVGFQVVGGLLAAFVLGLVLFVLAEERDEKERSERDRMLAEVGGPEAVAKAHLQDALNRAETRAIIRTMASVRA